MKKKKYNPSKPITKERINKDLNAVELEVLVNMAADQMKLTGDKRREFIRIIHEGLTTEDESLANSNFELACRFEAEYHDNLENEQKMKEMEKKSNDAVTPILEHPFAGIRAWNDLRNRYAAHVHLAKSFYLTCVVDTLVEVIDMTMQQAIYEAHQCKTRLDDDDIHFINTLKQRVGKVREHIRYRIRTSLTQVENCYGESALDDSDWLKDVILLCIDRVGNEPDTRVPMLKRAIKRLGSRMDGMYDNILEQI